MISKIRKKKNSFGSLFENDKLKSIKATYGYLSLCFAVPALIMLLIYLVMGHEPIANGSVLVLDLNAQYVYFYEALRDFVWGDGSLLYSFSRSLGGEFMGIYAYYLASPLSYIVALFPKSGILYALLLIILIKIGLCGFTFGFYLHKKTKTPKKLTVIMFSAMYALTAYNIVYQNNIMWLDAVILLPILTYSIERLVKRKRFKLFVITLSLIMMSHYYIGYMLCWYVFFCFFFTYFKDSDRTLINPTGEKSHFVKSLLRITAASAVAIGIAAFMICAAYYSLTFGKTTFTEPDWSWNTRFDLLDILPKLLPGAYDTVMHEGLPNIYCGVLTLFMLPVYFMAKQVTSREKIFYSSFAALYLLITVINPFDLVMHGFQMPNCLNYRYSFIICFLLLFMAYRGFCEIKKHSAKVIFSIAVCLTFMVFVLQKFEYKNFVLQDGEYFKYGYVSGKLPFLQVILLSLVAVFVIGAILCYLIKTKKEKLVSAVLFGAICLELFGNGAVLIASLGCDVGYSSYSSYVGFFSELRPFVESIQDSDNGFYRMEKTFHRTTNDNMALGMKGLSNSTSTLNSKVISMLSYLGYTGDSHYTRYLGGTPLSDSLFGIKYVVSRKDDLYGNEPIYCNNVMGSYYIKNSEDDTFISYKNPYALSLAYAVSSSVNGFDFYNTEYDYKSEDGYKTPFQVMQELLNTMTEENSTYFTPISYKTSEIEYENTQSSRLISVDGGTEYQVSADSSEEKAFIHFNITANISGPAYLYLPSKYNKNHTVFVNDEECATLTEGNRIVCLGCFESGDSIKVSIRIDESYVCFAQKVPIFYSADMSAIEASLRKLSQEMLSIDDSSSDSHITGTIVTGADDRMILTTIPYDSGWIIKSDGKVIDTYSTMNDTFLAFNIEDAGTHTIEMIYRPKIYVISAVISALSLAGFVTFSVIEYNIRKKKSKTIKKGD